MSTRSKSRRHYSPEFKEQVLELLGMGRPVVELAEEFGVSSNLLYSWRSKARRAQGGSAGPRAEGELDQADELRALRRELAHLRAENDILKKAAVILATKPRPSSAL